MFKWLLNGSSEVSGSSWRKTKKPKTKGDVVTCHDCGKVGYCIPKSFDCYIMPAGWKHFDIGFSRLYLCGDCCAKRKKFGERLAKESDLEG